MNMFKRELARMMESHENESTGIINRSNEIINAMGISLDYLRIMIDENITFRIDHKYIIVAEISFLKPFGWTDIAYIKNYKTNTIVKQNIDSIIKKIEKMANE